MQAGLTIFGRRLELQLKAAAPQPLTSTGGWWRVIRESFTGAWQRNAEIKMDTVMTYFAVFACTTLIASDIGKLCLRLVQKDADGIWTETDSPSFSPVLRKPNHFQTTQQFIETWVTSLLTWGNTYVLKVRDNRGVVVKLFVLDPSRVTPLVATDGSVYYQLQRDDLSGLSVDRLDPQRNGTVTVPAPEIIHDRMNAIYHPLMGLSPIYACGTSAMEGLKIQANSSKFFESGSNPGGVLTAPGAISDETAVRLKAYWDTNFSGDNVGKVAVLGDGLKFEQMSVTAHDAQLIEQLKWTGETVCTCFHVPAYMVDIGPPPPYANIEPVIQKYFSQCLQTRILGIENGLDEGLGLTKKIDGVQYGTEFDINDLIWMDMAARNKAASDGISSGGMSPNEARRRFFQLGKVAGGDTPYLQQQYFSLAALAERDAADPFAKPAPAPAPTPQPDASSERAARVLSLTAAVARKRNRAA
jgi:HK97 family phage portal protein